MGRGRYFLRVKFWLAIGLVGMGLTGCSNKQALSDYNEISGRKGVLSLEQAIDSGSFRPLSIGRKVKSALSKSDPLLQKASSVSNFHLYKFSSPEDGDYLFDLKALCGCFGLNRSLFKPVVHVFDESRKEFSPAGLSYVQKRATFTLPLREEATWKLELSQGQTVYVLLAADNRAVGRTVMEDLIHKVVQAPVGKYHFSVTPAVSVD